MYICTLCSLVAGCDSSEQAPELEPDPGSGDVIDVELLRSYTVEEINELTESFGILFSARYGSAVYRIEYLTVDADGELIMASGAVAVPQPTLGMLPMVSFQSGTTVLRSAVPSGGEIGKILVGLFFSADGYLSVMPDMIGLGSSPGLHPYLIADASASAVIDLLQAVVRWSVTQPWDPSSEVYLVGYSSGGHSTMAAQRTLEADYGDQFTVVASAPMAGPYDLSGTMLTLMLAGEPYPEPHYLPYILLSYNDAYDLFASTSDFLKSPYDITLPPLFDGTHSSSEINDAMPEVPIQVVRQDVLQAVKDDSDYPFLQRLRENDVTNWVPRSSTRLYHCAADEIVPIENSQIAVQRFGSTATLVDPSPQSGHFNCAFISIASARAWFNSIVTSGGSPR